MITTEDYNKEETQKILEALNNFVLIDHGIVPGMRGTAGQVVTTLVYVLVEKGLISLQDVQRLTKSGAV